MGGLQSKHGKSDHPSSTVHLRDKKDLAGVGIIFRKGPDGSLIVKELIDGSCAEECKQIQTGDTLTQVDDIRISKVSIAEVSGMILGEPGQPVRLKFSRSVGRSKRKYKVVLKRTVRATLEPTYRVQRDGINTRVTHIHLDCMQNRDNPAADAAPEISRVRDVLDANGNVVGPGLLERARTIAASREQEAETPPIPGVERIDASHPAWPGKRIRSKGELSGKGGQLPKLKSKQAGEDSFEPSQPPLQADRPAEQAPEPLAPSALQASPSDEAMQASCFVAGGSMDSDLKQDGSSWLDAFGLGSSQPANSNVIIETAKVEANESSLHPSSDFLHPSSDFLQPSSSHAEAVAPESSAQTEKFVAVAVPAPETEEEGKGGGGLDWEGLAESRIAVFEAKRKEFEPSRSAPLKAVDLEKEWARTAQAAQGGLKERGADGPAQGGASGKGGGAAEGRHEAKQRAEPKVESKPLETKPPESKVPPPGTASPPVQAASKDALGTPKKLGLQTAGKGTDLAALMAARKKKMEDDDEDGFYF